MSVESNENSIVENNNKFNTLNALDISTASQNTTSTVIVVTGENILRLLTSTQIKERMAAYAHIHEYPEHVHILQNEKQILAIEVAINALNEMDNIKNNDVEMLYVNIGASKASIQKKTEQLLDKIANKEFENVYEALIRQLENKSKKVVCETLRKLLDYGERMDKKKIRELSKRLKQLFECGDEATKKICVKVCVLVYRVIGDDLLKDIEGIKQILFKEVLRELEKEPKKKVPLDISTMNFNSDKWKERLEAMNYLKESLINRNNGEVVAIINQALGDSNFQVAMAAVECVRNGAIDNREVVAKMVLRFREKKAGMKQLIKEALKRIGEENSGVFDQLGELLNEKNSEIRNGILESLAECGHVGDYEKVIKLLDDGNGDVRSNAAYLLWTQSQNCLDDEKKNKVEKLLKRKVANEPGNNTGKGVSGVNTISKSTGFNNSAFSNAPIKTHSSASNGNVTKSLTSNISYKRNNTSGSSGVNTSLTRGKSGQNSMSCKSVCDLLDKYSFLKENDWNKKIDGLRRNFNCLIAEPAETIVAYVIKNKDNNMNLLKVYFGLLSETNRVSEFTLQICPYIFGHVTEPKLQDAIFKLCICLDRVKLVEALCQNVLENKSGKKFLTLIALLGRVLNQQSRKIDMMLENLVVVGCSERRALEEFKRIYAGLSTGIDTGIDANGSGISGFEASSEYGGSLNVKKTDMNNNDVRNSTNGSNSCINGIGHGLDCSFNNEKNNSVINSGNIISNSINNNTNITSNITSNMGNSFINNEINSSNHDNSNYSRILKISYNAVGNAVKMDAQLSEVFTNEFLEMFDHDTFRAVSLLEILDKIEYSTLFIRLYTTHALPGPYFEALLAYYIERRYILKEGEAKCLAEYFLFNSLENELGVLDRIYPSTKLYKIYQRWVVGGYEVAGCLREIKKLVEKYKKNYVVDSAVLVVMVRESDDFIKLSKRLISKESVPRIRTTIVEQERDNDGTTLLNSDMTISDIENSFIISDCCSQKENQSDYLLAPSIYEGSGNQKIKDNKLGDIKITDNKLGYNNTMGINSADNNPIDNSSEAVHNNVHNNYENSRNNPVNSDNNPMDNRTGAVHNNYENNRSNLVNSDINNQANVINNNTDTFSNLAGIINERANNNSFNTLLEKSLENISISTTPVKKKRDLNAIDNILSKIIHPEPAVAGAAIDQLNALMASDPDSFLFSANTIASSLVVQLFDSFDTLSLRKSILNTLLCLSQNIKFCRILRYETLRSINVDLISIALENKLAADILISLCLNCSVHILKVYYGILASVERGTPSEIVMKLIWRHAKRIDGISYSEACEAISIIDQFFEKEHAMLAVADNVIIKVCLLHIKTFCMNYSDGIFKFSISPRTRKIVDFLLNTNELKLDGIRDIFK